MARNIETETSPNGENLGARNWRLEFSLHHALPTHVFPSQDLHICRIPCLELKGVQSSLDWFLLFSGLMSQFPLQKALLRPPFHVL